MKLEAAAAVLGVAVDADPETLKAAYRRLALRWHPDRCKEADAKERFQEVSVAYTRLVSGESGRDHDGDGSERFYDDVDEMRAFMSMFMELVGMFGSDIPSMPNGCGPGCKGGHVHVPPGMPPDMADMPSASVAFSMMFGERPQEETWSSEEEEGEGREEDYDHDEEEFDLDEDCEPESDADGQQQQQDAQGGGGGGAAAGSSASASAAAVAAAAAAAEAFKAGAAGSGGAGGAAGGECLWEPMVRHYFHMNLKEEVEQQRAAGLGGASLGSSEAAGLEEEALRQARALKKRQDKKRRQKEKKQQQRASAAKVQEAADRTDSPQDEGKGKKGEESEACKRKEVVRLKKKAEEERRVGLFTACRAGFVEEVRLMLGTGLVRCTERERENGTSGASLLHSCVTGFAGSPDNAPQLKGLAADRLSIAAMILGHVDPAVDAGCVDSAGLTVLHRVAEALDLPYLGLLLEERQKSQERRDQILLNERCLLKGWTPLHYAAAEGSPAGVSTLLAAGASVSVHGAVLDGIESSSNGVHGGGVGGGGGGRGEAEAGTALQLARALLSKEGAGPRKKGLQEVARQLSAATQVVERAKEQRERKEREAKLAKKRSEVQKEKKKEARERELLSRKQRQLKDKQERQEREERQEEERRGRKEEQGKAEEGKSKKAKKAKKKKNKTGGDDEDSVADRGSAAATSADGDGDEETVSAGKQAGGDASAASMSRPHLAAGASPSPGSTTVGGAGAPPVVSESVHESSMSRDDLLAQLITMGFQEEHVHRGTSCVGFDLNALLSWLVDHPDGGTTPAEQASAAASKATTNARRKGPASKANAKVDAGKGNSGVISSALRTHGHGSLAGVGASGGAGGGGPGVGWGGGIPGAVGVGVGVGKDGGAVGVGAGGGGNATSLAAAAAKAEEKRRQNLELRRINRAWNASLPLRRAEEEEKKAAETAREKELEDAKDEKRRLMESQRAAAVAAVAARQAGSMQQTPPTKPMQGGPSLASPFPLLGNGIRVGGLVPNKAMARSPNAPPGGVGLASAKLVPQGLPPGVNQRGVGGANPNVRGGVSNSPSGVNARPGVGGGGGRVDLGASKGNTASQKQQQQQQQQQQAQQQQQQGGAPGRRGGAGDVAGRAGQQQQQQQQPQQQHMNSSKTGPMPYGNRAGVANGGGGGAGASGGGGGAAGAAGARAGSFPPGVGRGHMGVVPGPGFSPHGPHPAAPPGAPLGMAMNVSSHLGGHMPHGGQSMPFPGGFRPGQPGQNHNPLQATRGGGPRGAPPQGPHGYGASPTMGPTLPSQPSQGPGQQAEWAAARQRAAAAAAAAVAGGWSNTPGVHAAGGPGPGLRQHPHQQHHQHRGGASAPPAGAAVPWGDPWGAGGGGPRPNAPEGGDGPAASPGGLAQQQQQQQANNMQQQRRRQQQQQQRPEATAASKVSSQATAAVASTRAAAPAAPAQPTKTTTITTTTTTTTTPRTPSLTSSVPGSPGDADDISLAMQNGELSAAARVFVPTNISPAKPALNGGASGGSTPVSRSGAARSAAAGATPPRPPAAAASGSSPGLRSSPAKGGGGGAAGAGLGLPLADGVFGPSWGGMGGVGGGTNNAASSAADASDDGGSSSNLWGSLGIDVGGAGVPASGQAIWGGSVGGGGGASAGDGVSLLLAPSTGSAVQAPVDAASLPSFSSSSPLDLSSWDVAGGGGGRAAGAGALAGDVGGLSSSVSGLSMDDSANNIVGGKVGEQPPQPQPGGFGSGSGLSSWG